MDAEANALDALSEAELEQLPKGECRCRKCKRTGPTLDHTGLCWECSKSAEDIHAEAFLSEIPALLRLEVPVAEVPPHGYIARHVDVRFTPDQARQLRRIVQGLDRQQAVLRNGRRVTDGPKALMWLLENLAEPALEVTEVTATLTAPDHGEEISRTEAVEAQVARPDVHSSGTPVAGGADPRPGSGSKKRKAA